MPTEDFLTADAVAAQLGLTAEEVRHRAYHGEIHWTRARLGELLFTQADLDEYRTQMVEPPEDA